MPEAAGERTGLKPLTSYRPGWPISWEKFLGQLYSRAYDLAERHEHDREQMRTGLWQWLDENAAVIHEQCDLEGKKITDAVIEAAVEDADENAGFGWLPDVPRVRFPVPIESENDLLRIAREILAARPHRDYDEMEARVLADLNRYVRPPLDPFRRTELVKILIAGPSGPSQPGRLGSPANPVAPATPASTTASAGTPRPTTAAATPAPAPKPATKPVLKKERTYDPLMQALARDRRVTDAVRLTYIDILPELVGNPTEPLGHLWKTHAEVAVLTGKSARTIKRHVGLLIEWGYMRVEGKHANQHAMETHYVVARGAVPLPKRYDKDKVGIPEGYNGPPGLEGLEGQ